MMVMTGREGETFVKFENIRGEIEEVVITIETIANTESHVGRAPGIKVRERTPSSSSPRRIKLA